MCECYFMVDCIVRNRGELMRLYEIINEIENFEFEIDEETGEILNYDALDQLEYDRQTKIENIGLWIKNLRAEADAVKAEKKNLADRESKLTKKADNLESYLAMNLDGEEFSTPRLAIGWRKSESTEILDIDKIPAKYLKTKTEISADKTAIKKAIKAGEKIEGATIVEKNNIQVN